HDLYRPGVDRRIRRQRPEVARRRPATRSRPAGETPGDIVIRFQWYQHRNGTAPARGTIVAVSGGPGAAKTMPAP
ncbi:MAG: hypothetical protein ACREEE_12690, partial [Dongiaceae bacterium]